jgi:HEAT repeat protein
MGMVFEWVATVAHAFISYVRENTDVVDRIALELRKRGATVWLDRENIEPGTPWRDAIQKAIQNGKFFIACFSKEYDERDRTHMNEEITTAIDELRSRPSDKAWFIPVLVNPTRIPSRRISSVETLSDIQAIEMYPDWEKGIARLVRALKYDDPLLRRVWHLVDIIDRPFDRERLYAIRQLRSMRSAEPEVVFSLKRAAEDTNQAVRISALDALGDLGPAAANAAPTVIAAVRAADESVRSSAIVALGKIGPAADVVTTLIAALESELDILQKMAADALGHIGSAAAEAVPVLIETFQRNPRSSHYDGKEANLHDHALAALAKIGPAVIPALIAVLETPQGYYDICNAADVLGMIGPAAADAVPALISCLESSDRILYDSSVIIALGKIGPAASCAVPILIDVLIHDLEHARGCGHFAADALGMIGAGATEAVPVLVAAFDGPRYWIRDNAETALAKIGPPAIPALIDTLQRSSRRHIRERAAGSLSQMGQAGVPSLIACCASSRKAVRQSAVRALAKIGAEAVANLVAALQSPQVNIRQAAITSLAMIGPAAAGATPALLAILTGSKESAARVPHGFGRIKEVFSKFRDSAGLADAADALAKIGSTAVPGLIAALDDSRRIVRINAAGALTKAGKAAVPALIAALRDPRGAIRNRAANILVQIGPPAIAQLDKLSEHGDQATKRIAAWTLAQIRHEV